MRIYDQRVSRGLSVSTAALLSVVGYLILDVILSFTQTYVNPIGDYYNLAFGIIEFVIATAYWILINFILFSRPGRSGKGAIITYLVFNMLPIIIFTTVTSMLIFFYPTSNFTLSWNLITWIIAPTLFWFTPFSYLFYVFGYYITIPTFTLIVLIYMIGIQFIGIILGLARRASVQEKMEALRKQQEREQFLQQRPELAFDTVSRNFGNIGVDEDLITVQQSGGLYTGTNPFRERETDSVIISTDTLDVITDEMLNEYQQEPAIEKDIVFTQYEKSGLTDIIIDSTEIDDSIFSETNLNNFIIDDLNIEDIKVHEVNHSGNNYQQGAENNRSSDQNKKE